MNCLTYSFFLYVPSLATALAKPKSAIYFVQIESVFCNEQPPAPGNLISKIDEP